MYRNESFLQKKSHFFSSKRNIFVKYTYIYVESKNAKPDSGTFSSGVFSSIHNKNSIGLLNRSNSRRKVLSGFAKQGSTVLFLFNKFSFRKMRNPNENANNANNSSVVARITHETGNTKSNVSRKTQVLSDVMKSAWRFFRMTGTSFPECLQRAWRNYNLVKRMLKGIVHFYFQKVDGTIREAWGTLSAGMLPEVGDGRKRNDFVQVYFDTEKNEFRSFKKFNLVSIT